MKSDADFLRAICESPHDDAARLIYADWLEENGRPDRAEFIRVQVALARLPPLATVILGDGAGEVRRGLVSGYLGGDPAVVVPGAAVDYFAGEVGREVGWNGAGLVEAVGRDRCGLLVVCIRPTGPANADRRRRDALRRREYGLQRPGVGWWSDYGPGNKITVLEWRRGFAEVAACALADWLAHGPAVVLAQPVTEVRLSDYWFRVIPHNDGRMPSADWVIGRRDGGGVEPGLLEIYRHTRAVTPFRCFRSGAEAEADLSRRLITDARTKAALPPLPNAVP